MSILTSGFGDGTPTLTGVLLAMVPTDARYGLRLLRTSDNGGGGPASSAAVTVVEIEALPADGRYFVDRLPDDGAARYYQQQQYGPTVADGVPSAWTSAAIPTALPLAYLRLRDVPAGLYPLPNGGVAGSSGTIWVMHAASCFGETLTTGAIDGFGQPIINKFNKPGTSAPDNLDGVPDGTTYARPKTVLLSSGILKRQYPRDDGNYDAASASSQGTTLHVVMLDGLGAPVIAKFNKSGTSAPDTLDGVPDGTSYARPKTGLLSSGILKRQYPRDDGNYDAAASSSQGTTLHVQMLDAYAAPVVAKFNKPGTSAPDSLDGVPDGSLTVRPPKYAGGQNNLVDNPNWQLSTDLPPIGWIRGAPGLGPANVTMSWDTSAAYYGARSLVLASTANLAGVSAVRTVPVIPGESYQLQAALRCSSQQGQFALYFADAAGAFFGAVACASTAADGAWHVVSANGQVPTSAASGLLICALSGANGGLCEFDALYAIRTPSRGQTFDDGGWAANASSSGGMTLSSGVMDGTSRFINWMFAKSGSSAPDTVDSVPDGTSYARPKVAVLSSGVLRRDYPLADGNYSLGAADALGKAPASTVWLSSTSMLLVGSSAAPSYITKNLRVAHTGFTPLSAAFSYSYGLGYVSPAAVLPASYEGRGAIVLPPGVTVINLTASLYRGSSNASAVLTLYRVETDSSSAPTAIATLTASTALGWQNLSAALSQTVSSSQGLVADVALSAPSSGLADDARFGHADCSYTMASYDHGY